MLESGLKEKLEECINMRLLNPTFHHNSQFSTTNKTNHHHNIHNSHMHHIMYLNHNTNRHRCPNITTNYFHHSNKDNTSKDNQFKICVDHRMLIFDKE